MLIKSDRTAEINELMFAGGMVIMVDSEKNIK